MQLGYWQHVARLRANHKLKTGAILTSMNEYDIHKAAAIILHGHKVLQVRAKGKDVFISPGGKLESGETVNAALIRELLEELSLNVNEDALTPFGTFYAIAAGTDTTRLRMDALLTVVDVSKIKKDHEIEELVWIDSTNITAYPQGSIFEHDIFPQLLKLGLVH